MGYRYLLFLIIFIKLTNLLGQNCFIQNLNLPDGTVRSIPLVLSGTDLTLSQDQICKINIRFKHESVNQLRIRLISPSGQSVQLIGPADALSNTIFPSPTYDLTFIRCTENPDPEPGYSAVWNNNQTWIGSRFSGSYHPHQGCLNDFNLGPISGTWQLEIQDVARFDEGVIECFSIEFCNSPNIVSTSCDDRKGRIQLTNATICEYDSIRMLPLTDFPSGRPASAVYSNRYVVMSGTEIIRYENDTIKNLEPGNYTVCQFIVSNADIPRLPPIGALISNANFSQEFARLNLCGSVSDQCLSLTINPIPARIVDNSLKICKNGTINFKNRIITNPGSYTLFVPSTSAGVCDTVYQILVEEVDLGPSIGSSSTTLLCNGDLILSDASINTSANALYTFSGPGIVSSTPRSATINIPGIYKMVVRDQGCVDSSTLTIVSDPNLPRLSFTADTITCNRINAVVTVNTTGQSISNTSWTRGSILSSNSITTDVSGKLIATVTHADGCIITDSLVVQIDTVKIKPNLQLSEPDLTCSIRTINTTVQNGDIYNSSFIFKKDEINVSNISSITDSGSYKIIAQLTRNGCIDSTSVIVRDLQEVPSVTLESFCDNNNVLKVRAIIERDPINLFWTFPSGQTGNPASLEQIVTASGEFSFGYISAAGCRSRDTSITVDIAQAFPIITAPDDSLACDRREILLDPGTIDPNATYSWVGPNNFSSNNPTPTINTIGTYAGVARYQNGCFTRDTSRIFLRTDETPFDLSEVINVTCEDTLSLVPQDRLKYSYNWRTDISPAIISNINDTVYTVNPGVYILEISQAGNLCYTIPVTIGDERDFPILSPNKNDISCDPNLVSQISLNPNNPDLINRVEWFGPNGFTSTAINISNLEEGTYRYLLTTVRGCNLRDTFEIIANTNAPRISFLQDSILLSCDDYNNTLGRNIQINSLDPVSNFSWVRDGDAAILSTNNSLIIIREGRYTVRAIGSNSCESIRSIFVGNDTINSGLINITPIPITCDLPTPTITPIHPNGFRQINVFFNGQSIGTNMNSFVITRAGNYRLESIDNRGCRYIDDFLIENRTDSVKYNSLEKNVGCDLGNITLQLLNPASNIIWFNSNADTISTDTNVVIENPGTYFVNLVSPLGCMTIDSFIITRDDAIPLLTSVAADTITCANPIRTINLDFDRPIRSIVWKSSSIDTTTQVGVLSINVAETIKWELTADNGCKLEDSINVQIDTISPIHTFIRDTLTCLRPITFVRTLPNISIDQYLWEGPSNFVSRDSLIRTGIPGIYRLTSNGNNGCQSVNEVEILENKAFPTLTLPDSINLPCTDDSLLIVAVSDQPIRELRWVAGRSLLSRQNNLLTRTPGIIKLFVISVEGCQTEDSTFVYLDTTRALVSLAGNNITCDPDTAYINASINSKYLSSKWITPLGIEIPNVLNIESQDSGTFRLIVERLPMCIDTFELFIDADRVKPTLDIVQLNPIKCEVREAVLVGSAFHFRRNTLQYSWNSVTGNIVGSNNLDTIRVNRPATYTFRAIDTINNCSEARFISVSEDEDDLDTFTVRAIDPVCFAANDGTIRIVNVEGGTAPYGISLSSTTPFVRDSIIRNLRAGTYSVFLRDSFGCAQSTMITLNEGQRTFVRLPNDTTLTLGSNLIVDYVSDIDPQSIRDIIWMASNGQNCDGCTSYDGSFLDNTNLLLVVTNANGCVAIDSMNIFVLPIINWVFPNILSVSSNENSTLIIPENAGVDVINNFSIYDRWGNIIWQAQNFKPGDPNFNFDIRNQSSTIENGVYIFKIDATLINGAKWQRVKDFTVIK